MKELEIPEGWKKIKLKEVLKEVSERNKGQKVKRVLSITNSQGFVNQEEYFEGTVHSADISQYKIVRKNQFAYNPSRVNVGSIDILKDYDEGALSPMYVIFEVDTEKLLPEYFKYYFETHRFYENVKNNTQGSVRYSLSFKALVDFEYLLPPIEEQEKIVRILMNIDEVHTNYEKNNNEQINYMNYIMKKTLDKKGDMIKLREIGEIITGNTPKTTEKDNYGEEYNWVTPGDMGISKYITNTEKKLSLKGFEKSRKVNKGSILVTCIGSTIGKIGIAGKECSTNQQINSINLFNNINNEYVYYAIKYNFKYFTDYISNQAVPIINKTVFGNLRIPNISLSRQKKIAITLKILDKKIECNKKIIDEYKKLKKALMQKLLTGKVRVKI